MRFILAVESVPLRAALLTSLSECGIRLETVVPDDLASLAATDDACILLETSDDPVRLSRTARESYDLWTRSGRWINFLAYLTEEVYSDAVVFDLWRIGPEMTVIVQRYDPWNLSAWMRGAAAILGRLAAIPPTHPVDS
jgi:hypothetical protein